MVAWLYAVLIYYIPFIYINAFLTVGFGGAITMITVSAMRGAKLRNKLLFGLVSLLTGGAFFAHWAVWLGHLLRASDIEVIALDVFRVTATKNEKGSVSKERKQVVSNLLLTTNEVAAIRSLSLAPT